jgi:hypothetical protein
LCNFWCHKSGIFLNGIADVEKIGLFGHSFWRLPTGLYLLKTDLFNCCNSGNSVFGCLCHYFNYNSWGSIDGWRYENQQFADGFPFFFDNKEGYYSNSPLQNIVYYSFTDVDGKLDENIRPEQLNLLRRIQTIKKKT